MGTRLHPRSVSSTGVLSLPSFLRVTAPLREICPDYEAIARFAGSDGVYELALLESAVAAPQATCGGRSPYKDIAEVAATYLFYLCRGRPFIDGNKRAALGACIVFLRLNCIEPKADGPEWERLARDGGLQRAARRDGGRSGAERDRSLRSQRVGQRGNARNLQRP